MFRDRTSQRVPIRPHGVVRQMAALPWFDGGARRAETGNCKQEKESEQFHGGGGTHPNLRREER